MAMHVGETVTIKAVARNPVLPDKPLITDATAVVERYAVGTNPKTEPDDRTVVATTAMEYDADAGAYLAFINTDGFEAGKHPYRVILGGAYDSWEYGTFTLKA